MKSTVSAALALAGLVATVAGHGQITSPARRTPGTAMQAACGLQMYNNQAADAYGNIQGELQVATGQSDFDAAACNVWLCKGYKFDDNTANVQTYTAGQVVPITFDVRAPHTGTANVSIVKTSSNSVIGAALKSWDVFASTATPIPDDDKNFDITIPSDLGSECATAGDCVIQMFWDARSIDQTYESCIDFTVGGSGSGSGDSTPVSSAMPVASSTPVSTPVASSAPAPAATTSAAAVVNVPSSTPVATPSATPVPSSTPSSGGSTTLPETFTLDQFITWLQQVAGSSSSKVRRSRVHARAF